MYPPLLALAILLLAISLRTPGAELKGARLFKSGPIQITADGRFVWTVNPDHDSVSRLDTASDALVEFSLPAGEKQNPKGLSLKEDGNIQWVTEEKGKQKIYSHDPKAILRRIQAFFMGLLPLEDQL